MQNSSFGKKNIKKSSADGDGSSTPATGSDDDEKPLSIAFSKEEEEDEDDKPLSQIKSKLSITPMVSKEFRESLASRFSFPQKMSCRGRPPKEAYVLVDEDTQTFPKIEDNRWYYYK